MEGKGSEGKTIRGCSVLPVALPLTPSPPADECMSIPSPQTLGKEGEGEAGRENKGKGRLGWGSEGRWEGDESERGCKGREGWEGEIKGERKVWRGKREASRGGRREGKVGKVTGEELT